VVGAPPALQVSAFGRPSQGSIGLGRRAHRRAPAARTKLTTEGTMPTEAKVAAVADLREQLSKSRTLIVSEYRGLTVREIAEIRRSLRKQDVTYRVVKNRLLKIAAADTVGAALDPLLVGPTAIAFGQDEGATAKAVIDTMRPYKTVRITGAVLGDRAVDAAGVTRLASLPSRDTLLSQLAGAFAAPMATTAGLFDAPVREIAGLVQALADRQAAAA
jgi:large subunit ribosomal protein L10